jgi:GT2 family glycosyltransferase
MVTRAPLRLVERRATRASSGEGVSVVVPHGGPERLPHLERTLARLREVACVLDVAVVEMDERPHALGVARRLADAYAFVKRDGIFHKARAMNAGVPLAARAGVVLWLDNDLLLPEDFLPKALAEMHRRRLDCLVPWTSVRYLSREETAEVFKGRRAGVGDCAHVNAYYTRQGACGGAVLVRRDFLRRAGGMCEGFRGWGGEDNAWFYRARVLGAAAVTQRPDQHLYHLHHENSGGYAPTNHAAKNPNYDSNVALLHATRRVRSRAEMLARFPAPRHFTCPWDAARRVAFAFADGDAEAREAAGSTADALRELYGFEVERVSCGDGLPSDGVAESLRACDAVVVFGERLALTLLGDERLVGTQTRMVVSHVGGRVGAFDGGELEVLVRAGAHFSFGGGAAHALEAAGLDCWRPLGGEEACGDASDAALGLAQPLSLAVAGAAVASVDEERAGLELHADARGNVDTQHTDGGPMVDADFTIPEAIPEAAAARESDLSLPEYAAFNHGRDYPRMRRWELPFALFKARLASTSSVLDCTINPLDFGKRLQSLYPHALYRHWNPVRGDQFALPLGVPDEAFDRVVCVNTLEHLLSEQREALLAEMARKLKPGGLLVLTCDYYFDDLWSRPELLAAGVVREDGAEVFGGFNRVAPDDLLRTCARHGLSPFGEGAWAAPSETDGGLYRNAEPHPHATVGAVFVKGGAAPTLPAARRVVLALLTWNTRDISLEALAALAREAGALRRLDQRPFICVCDNGSTDGTQEALREASARLGVEHKLILNAENRGSSVARNQIIDYAVGDCDADYLLFTDGDIEIVPFSSFAMLRHMEDAGHLLGCLGAHMYGQSPARAETTPRLFSLDGLELRDEEVVAWTQYGMFRREVFDAGVRFDDAYPFDREGWGCEDNDLAFQLLVKGYRIRCFKGMTYLHRNMHSSMRILRALGHDPKSSYETRKRYVVEKWSATPAISAGPLRAVRIARAPAGS